MAHCYSPTHVGIHFLSCPTVDHEKNEIDSHCIPPPAMYFVVTQTHDKQLAIFTSDSEHDAFTIAEECIYDEKTRTAIYERIYSS